MLKGCRRNSFSLFFLFEVFLLLDYEYENEHSIIVSLNSKTIVSHNIILSIGLPLNCIKVGVTYDTDNLISMSRNPILKKIIDEILTNLRVVVDEPRFEKYIEYLNLLGLKRCSCYMCDYNKENGEIYSIPDIGINNYSKIENADKWKIIVLDEI